jgi:hypothetical protein
VLIILSKIIIYLYESALNNLTLARLVWNKVWIPCLRIKPSLQNPSWWCWLSCNLHIRINLLRLSFLHICGKWDTPKHLPSFVILQRRYWLQVLKTYLSVPIHWKSNCKISIFYHYSNYSSLIVILTEFSLFLW